ncbi:uncharacterized protein [Montipora capricornis]|uniref:uncharacterized protein n=1 Tax=Montipora capricornis TaxID=246305 RepID=UPI0035F20D09
MAGQAVQIYNAKDVEEAVQRGIQRGIASYRNEVSRKQVCTPACKEGQKWDYPQVKAIAGQGKLYVRLLKPQATMGQEEPSTMNDHPSSIHVPEYGPQSLNECIVARMPAPTICSPQPSTSTACVFSSSINRSTLSNKGTEMLNILTCQQTFDEDEQKDIDNLRTMFPDKDKSYLSEVRRNNITLNDTIDDILGMEALDGWFCFM